MELVCEPVFDYGRDAAEWTLVGDDRHTADARGPHLTLRLQTDLAMGIEGNRVRARKTLHAGERAFCSLSWADELESPQDVAEADARLAATTACGARGSRGPDPGPPFSRGDRALGAGRSRA